MKLKARKYIGILVGSAALFLTSCGGGGGSSPGGDINAKDDPSTTQELPSEFSGFIKAMTVMASVNDSDGNPIHGALIGSAEGNDSSRTGSDGVAMGSMQPTTAGWYSVSATGFATDYVRPLGDYEGKTAFATRLTPVGSLQSWTTGMVDPLTVTVGESLAPSLSAQFGKAVFGTDVTISLTALDPLKTQTTQAPLDTTDPIYITLPFAIEAVDMSGQQQQPVSGETVSVTITDNGDMGAAPRLFWFNPEDGIWHEESGAGCVRLNGTKVQCQVSHFSQHGGAGSTPPSTPPPTDPWTARRNSDAAYRDWEASGDTENGPSQALIDALNAEMNAVIAWSKDHPSEEAKTMLVDTMGRLGIFGLDYQPLMTALFDVLDKLAAPHLQNPLCVNFEEIEHRLAQAMLVGAPVEDDLYVVYMELVEKCNVISGRIEYSIVLPADMGFPTMIGPDSAMPREGGASYWSEYHDIDLVVHIDDHDLGGQSVVVDGTDKVETDFPLVKYRDDYYSSCPFDTYTRDTFWGVPNKGQLEVTIHADANSTVTQFTNETLTGESMINLMKEFFDVGWEFEGTTNPVCVKKDADEVATGPLWENYQGQLMEQYKFYEGPGGSVFMGSFGEELPSLWDILNEEPDIKRPGSEDSYPTQIWRGSEILLDIVNLGGAENGPKVIMRWDLQHIDYTKGKWATHHQ